MFLARSEMQEHPDFRISFVDGPRTRTLGRSDFASHEGVQFDAGPFETSTSGTLRLACSILDSSGHSVAAETVRLPLRPGWRYSVTCAVGMHNPADACFGCLGSEATPLGPALGFAPGDSLFVVWGGTSISNPVLY